MANIAKADLIKEIAETSGMAQKDIKVVVDGLLERVEAHLKQGNKVQLTGFGTFEVRERKARTGVKPGTTEKIEIPASNYPAFKPGQGFKNNIK